MKNMRMYACAVGVHLFFFFLSINITTTTATPTATIAIAYSASEERTPVGLSVQAMDWSKLKGWVFVIVSK